MIDQVFHDRDDDGVAHSVVGLVVGSGEFVRAWSAHEESSLAGGNQAGFPFSGVVEEEKLATAAALCGAEAAGEVVKAKFEDLLALPGAAVAGEGSAAVRRESVEELPVFGGGEGDEGGSALFVENGGVPIDEIGEGLWALGGAGHGPEDDVIERGNGFENGVGVEPVGAVVFEGGGVEVILDGDDEDAGAGLGDPEAGVEQHGADLVGAVAEGLVEQAKIAAAIAGEEADDVLEGDDGGFFRHFVQHPEPFPEETTAGGGEATHLAGEGEVLAGEAGPDDVAVGNGAAADVLYGAEVEMAGAVVGGVDGGLLQANVVRPDRGAGVLGSLGDKAAAGKEIDESWKALGQRVHANSFCGDCQWESGRVEISGGCVIENCEYLLVGAGVVDSYRLTPLKGLEAYLK